MILKVMLDFDDFEDDARFDDFEKNSEILTILKIVLDFQDFEVDARF